MKDIKNKFYALLLIATFTNCFRQDGDKMLPDQKDSADIYLKYANDEKHNFSYRKKFNKKAEQLLIGRERDSGNITKLIKIARNYYNIYDLTGLKRILATVNENTLKKSDRYNLGEVYLLKEMLYEGSSQNDSAYYYCLKAEKIFNALGKELKVCKINYSKGLIKYYVNDYLGSDKDLVESLTLAQKLHSYEIQVKCYMMMSINSYDLGEYAKSLEYNYKALRVIKSKAPQSGKRIPSIYGNIGNTFAKENKIDSAIYFFKKALQHKDVKISDPQTYTYLLDNMEFARNKKGKYPLFPEVYLQTAAIRDSLNIDNGKTINKLYLSKYYVATHDAGKAIAYAKEALNLSIQFDAPNDMLLSLSQLSIADPTNELIYAKQYIKISDSIQRIERHTRNKFARIAYETDEITAEKDTAVLHKWILFAIAVTISLFAFLLLVIKSQKSKQRKLEFLQIQQKSNEEIYELIQAQQHKVDEGRQKEKQRIAQDLHDGIMNKLAGIRFSLHAVTKNAGVGIFEKSQPFINGIQDIEKEIRNIAHDLNKDVFAENFSFTNALNQLFEDFQATATARWYVEIDKSINWELLKSTDKIHIYRIFQEALQNIVKHANANNIIIKIALQEENLIVEVYDDGEGFPLNGTKKGIGLQNIRTRAIACGGTADIKSNGGTFIRIKIPQPTQTNIDNEKR